MSIRPNAKDRVTTRPNDEFTMPKRLVVQHHRELIGLRQKSAEDRLAEQDAKDARETTEAEDDAARDYDRNR